MAELTKQSHSPTLYIHPLATSTTAHTINSLTSTCTEDVRGGESEDEARTDQSTKDNILSTNRDHPYPKLNHYVPCAKTTGPMPTIVLFDSLYICTGENRPLSFAEEGKMGREDEVDIMSVDSTPKLPYDDSKVRTAMLECENHVNLVKLIAAKMDKRDLSKATPQQKALLLRVCEVLQADRLARLAYADNEDEPVYRRIHTDRAAYKIRQAFSDVLWDAKIIPWVNEVLLQSLDPILLPVYLDVLQVLKSKCPMLLERTIKSIVPKDSTDAFDFLLKRPWNPVVGLPGMDKQVKLQPSPNFVVVPHSPTPVSGRRMKSWQYQLGIVGKVWHVVLPGYVQDTVRTTSAEACARHIINCTCSKVQELIAQHPEKPIVLITWLSGSRMAVKVAETMSVSCIVALGTTTRGVEKCWDVSMDPLLGSRVPVMFVAGGNSPICNIDYLEKLRLSIQPLNKLVVVKGGDELLRLQPPELMALRMTQSMVDRCIQHEIFSFMVQVLPVKLMTEELKVAKKRKSSASQGTHELSSSQLTPIPMCVSPIPIPLEPESKKLFLNRSNSSGLSNAGFSKGASGSHSHYKSVQTGKGNAVPRPHKSTPTVGRPAGKAKKSVSYSSLKSAKQPSQHAPHSTPVCFTPMASGLLATPSSTSKVPSPSLSMSPSISPSQLLQVGPAGMIQPLPATPPRNPFAAITDFNPGQQSLAPSTLKLLNQPATFAPPLSSLATSLQSQPSDSKS